VEEVQVSFDLPQCLLRLHQLQRQLEKVRQERDLASAAEADWCRRYEIDTSQYRAEITLAAQTIAALRADIQRLQASVELEIVLSTKLLPVSEMPAPAQMAATSVLLSSNSNPLSDPNRVANSVLLVEGLKAEFTQAFKQEQLTEVLEAEKPLMP